MNRRHFIIEAGKAFPAMAGMVYLVGCDSNSSVDDNPGPMNVIAISSVSVGHTHSSAIPAGDLTSTSSRNYGSSSSSGHSHSVTLAAAQLSTINQGGEVTVTSTSAQGHTHQFTFMRADL